MSYQPGDCQAPRPQALTRRTTLLATALSASCRQIPPDDLKPRVQIVHAEYNQDLFSIVRRIFVDAKLDIKDRRVVLKPNLVEFESRTAINTHPMVVHAVLEAVRSLGAEQILIAEGPGHRRVTWDLADEAGYFKQIPRFEQSFVDLNIDELREVQIPNPHSALRSLYLPTTVLSADLLISIPKLKTHHWVGTTLSMKNLFGIVPGGVYGWPKNVLHWAGIAESIADLHKLIPRHFCVVDGIVGMEGNGPIQGEPKAAGILIAGADMPAVDATCCRVMKIDPAQIAYLQLTASNGQTNAERVIQTGESIAAVAQEFKLLLALEPLRLRAGS
jgi:uncharacterized protein (DUF362 family)